MIATDEVQINLHISWLGKHCANAANKAGSAMPQGAKKLASTLISKMLFALHCLQVLVVEAAYQRSLQQMREDWQREVAQLKADVRHKQAAMAYQAKNKEVGCGCVWMEGGG